MTDFSGRESVFRKGGFLPQSVRKSLLLLHTLSSPQPTWLPSTQVEAIRLQRVAPAEGEKPPHAHSSAEAALIIFKAQRRGEQVLGVNGEQSPPPTPHTCSPHNHSALPSSGALPICRPIASGQMDQHLHPSGRSIFATFFRGGKACSARVAFYRERTQAPLLLHTLSSPQPTGSRARKWGPFAFSGLHLLKAKSPHTRTRPLTAHRAHQQGGRPCACRVDDGQVRRTRHAHRSSFSGVSVYARKVLSLMRIASA